MNETERRILMSSDRMNWETPRYLFDYINGRFHEEKFNLDVWASNENALCDDFFTEEDSALGRGNWSLFEKKTAFGNPPYGSFLLTAIKEHYRQWIVNGVSSTILLPARTDTKVFHDYVLKSAEITFIKGRITFHINGKPVLDKKGKPMPAPFPSMLVHFYDSGANVIKFSTLDIKEAKKQ